MPRVRRAQHKQDDVITLGEYARAVGIGRTTAYVQARSGEIPAVWRGGRFELSRSDYERLVRQHRAAPMA